MNIINFYYKYSIATILDIIHENFKKNFNKFSIILLIDLYTII